MSAVDPLRGWCALTSLVAIVHVECAVIMGFIKVLFFSLAAASSASAAEILSPSRPKDVVPDQYIVVMKDDVSAESFGSHRAWVADIRHSNLTRRAMHGHGIQKTFDFHQMKGYSGAFDRDTIQEIARDPKVAFIEHDQVVKVGAYVEQKSSPSWGLGRVSHMKNGVESYYYDDSAGEGVWAYDIDTGVDITHPEFEGRAIWGSNHIDKDDKDAHGHGTHVGGIMGSKTYGVAKKIKVVAVKVLGANGAGTYASVVAGVDWSVNHAKENNALDKAVLNLSLGGGISAALNMAVANAVKAGTMVAAAAGNENADANTSSPGNEPTICTVAATDRTDLRAGYSNFGPLVDVYAPGSSIVSLAPGGGIRILTGTSMASPHVAGMGAYLIAFEKIPASKACDRIKELAISGAVRNNRPNTTDKLLYNGSGQ
ncbi:Secreted subtilisin-like serine protease sub5 [Emydomyces testavorans]|uniref:Secreted subtilisin-like serine protease sub5 n=1 Tax=Emydomyces testavorans TaxID=2070801 RepID=A0AAF0IKS4_9EURO|nr:Secreted subtilisin-like serine protease sub5 [Emydomyces testavorans]